MTRQGTCHDCSRCVDDLVVVNKIKVSWGSTRIIHTELCMHCVNKQYLYLGPNNEVKMNVVVYGTNTSTIQKDLSERSQQ